jgi:hypothetical protein
MSARIIYSVCIFILLFATPWWVASLAIAVGFFIFPQYIEGVILALVIDSLYVSASVHVIPYLMTTIATLLLLVVMRMKKNLKFYA